MDQEIGISKSNKMWVVTIILAVLLLVLVIGAALMQKPHIVSPLAENDANSVRVIFVSPESSASVSAQPSASSSATPKASPKTSPKSSPKASASAFASASGTPR